MIIFVICFQKSKSVDEDIQENRKREEHYERLIELLKVNGKQLVKIPEDGDCAFSAVVTQIKEPINVFKLRLAVSQHLIKFNRVYEPMTSPGLGDRFNVSCKALLKKGTWDTEISDIHNECKMSGGLVLVGMIS